MRRALAWVLAVGLAAACGAMPAPGLAKQRLLTWETKSRFVDLDDPQVRFNGVEPGLRVNVLLPDGYDGKKRFPVLYLLHGHGDAYNDWVDPDNGNVREIADGFPGIIVMPEGDRGWYTNWWNAGERGSPAWEDYHLRELIPLANRRLKIREGRRWHAIAGLSMGGEGALYYASQRPGYFGSAASFSGTISIQRLEWPAGFDTQGEDHLEVYGDPTAQRFYWSGHNPTALIENLRHTRLFVGVGDGTPNPARPDEVRNVTGQVAERDLSLHAQDFVNAAQDAGADVTYRPHLGIHDWAYWRADLRAAIEWGFFASEVPDHPDSWTFETVARRGRMWGLRFAFKDDPTTVETFARDGRTLSGEGDGKVVIRGRDGEVLEERLPFSRTLSREFFVNRAPRGPPRPTTTRR